MDTEASTSPPISEVRRSPLSEVTIIEAVPKGVQGGGITGRRPNDPLKAATNTQRFENSELADDPIVEAERNDPDRLFSSRGVYNHTAPNLVIIAEKPEHRIIVYLKAQGLSNKEVADRTGYTQSWISQLTRQPWFRLRLVQELKDAGVDAITSVLKSAALDSVFTLIDLRDDLNKPGAVRRACADSLLDRFLGKPTQKIETDDKRLPSTPEISAIDSELQKIEKELQPDGELQPK